jgi:predicted  nucleic acid-binding Zn-ribbon protein
MHPDLKHLIELQAEDLRLAQVRGELAAFPKRLAELDARVKAAQDELAKAKEALLGSLKDRKKFELDVEQWKEKVRKYKDQIYEIKSNEAYKTLQHEIQMAEAEIAKAEDRLLDRMMAGEEFERQVKAAEKTLKEVEAAAHAERSQVQAQQAEAQKQADHLTAEREKALAAVPEDTLDHYHRIARKHAGVALAEVRDETCTMCRVRVRPHVFQELRRPDCNEIFHCESCTRILYYIEQPAAQSSAAAVAQSGES